MEVEYTAGSIHSSSKQLRVLLAEYPMYYISGGHTECFTKGIQYILEFGIKFIIYLSQFWVMWERPRPMENSSFFG